MICNELYDGNFTMTMFRHICKAAEHAKWFIQRKVKEFLDICPNPKGLDLFSTLIASVTGQIDILTLNHDYLVECYLKKLGIKFENGMVENGEVYEWNSDPYFSSKRAKVSILKLHGSIDWKYFYFSDPSIRSNYKLGLAKHIITGGNDFGEIETPRDKDGKSFTADFQLGFLVGKKTKAEYYNIVTYSEIFSTMTRLLKLHSLLIVAGYGFNDEFINHRIRYWTSQRNNKVLIFCPKSENEKVSNVFSTISDYRHNHLKYINKFPSDFNETEIKNLLNDILQFANT